MGVKRRVLALLPIAAMMILIISGGFLLQEYQHPSAGTIQTPRSDLGSNAYCTRWSRRMSRTLETLLGLQESAASKYCRERSL